MNISIETPLTRAQAAALHVGDQVRISGIVYTARDAAHKRLTELLAQGKPLPFPIQDAVIYYAGPAPAPAGRPIGSIGPTTSYRMDAYAPTLLRAGLRGMIGKGVRSQSVVDAIVETGSIYFGAIGGLGARLASCIRSAEIIAFEDLGTEAVRRLEIVDFPAFVITDSHGGSLYTQGRQAYLNAQEGKD